MSENINIKCDEIACLAHGQAVVEARQAVDGECKILSACAHAEATPGEVFTGEARYNGKVAFDCLVLTGDKVDCVSATAEFSDKIASPAIVAGMNVILMPETVNVEAVADGGAIKLTAVVDTAAIAVTGAETDCLVDPEPGVYAEKRTVERCVLKSQQTETVYVTDSIASDKLGEILFVTGRAVINGAEAADGAIKVTGALYSYIVARAEDGMINSERVVTPFVKDISAFGANASDVAYAFAFVDACSASVIVGENRTEISATLGINAIAVECKETEVIADVFCADNEITAETAQIKCFAAEPMITVTDAVDGQISLGAERLAADNVLCVTGTYCALSSVMPDDKRVTAEGLVGGDIVYYNAEKNTSDSIAFRLPFSIPLNVNKLADEIEATAVVTDVSVRIRRESVFDIKAEIAFTLRSSACKTETVVKSVTLGEAIPRPDASVIVHIAKPGETLWQAAKALCCSPERVTEQNQCSAPYSGGERLVNFCNKM